MRSYDEMMTLIHTIANEDDRIRAVVMNGSRVLNPRKDAFQDYDIVFFVNEYENFIENREWLKAFGQTMMMHTSDDMVFHPGKMDDGYMFQMLFPDKNRIDLLIRPTRVFDAHLKDDRNFKILLDKDKLSLEAPTPSTDHFFIDLPSYDVFRSCVKEILWVSPYIAKGLCRDEMLYAIEHLGHIRENVKALLRWRVGCTHGFDTFLKKASDDLHRYLDASVWNRFLSTYVPADKHLIWAALYEMLELTKQNTKLISKELKFKDNLDALDDLRSYLKEIESKC